MDVLWTGRPRRSAALTIQPLSTPPPSPPSAAIRMVMGRVAVIGCSDSRLADARSLSPFGERAGVRGLLTLVRRSPLTPTLSPGEVGFSRFRPLIVRKSGKPNLRWRGRREPADDGAAQAMQASLPPARIADDLGAI